MEKTPTYYIKTSSPYAGHTSLVIIEDNTVTTIAIREFADGKPLSVTANIEFKEKPQTEHFRLLAQNYEITGIADCNAVLNKAADMVHGLTWIGVQKEVYNSRI